MKSKENYYYDVLEDIKNYNDAWLYIIIGGRNTGKTYSALKATLINKIKFVFVKRTIEDVDLLCAGGGKIGIKQNEFGVDLSPFKSINRDMHTNIKAFSIKNGLGGFWVTDEEGTPLGTPLGYLLSLSAVSKFKGFDLSECDWIIFDEFIPAPWERVNKKEGDQLLDLYKTVARDREHRGKEPLKLICLANATQVSNPITNTVELVDKLVDMQIKGIPADYDINRGIFVRMINDNKDFVEKEKETMIYKAMGGTAWGKMAFSNEFAYNDFTSVGKINLKNYIPVVGLEYKEKKYYIYQKEGKYYMTKSQNNKCKMYNLNTENSQKAFYIDYVIDLKNECVNGCMTFESYSMYDLIINYRKFFII